MTTQELIFFATLIIIGSLCAWLPMRPTRRRSPSHSQRLRNARARSSWGVSVRRLRAGDA